MLIIHGEDIVSSYKKLTEVIENFKKDRIEIIIKEAQELDPTNLRQESGSTNLFGTTKCLVIKNLLSGSKAKQKDLLVKIVSQIQDTEVVLFESKKITNSALKAFPKAKVFTSTVNPVIFKFLDLLRPNNGRNLMSGWTRLIELDHEPEYIFAMLVRQFRLLIQAKSGPSYLKMSAYPKKLITEQATRYELNHLLDLHHNLYEIDKKIKTGSSSLPLDQLLIQFFLKI